MLLRVLIHLHLFSLSFHFHLPSPSVSCASTSFLHISHLESTLLPLSLAHSPLAFHYFLRFPLALFFSLLPAFAFSLPFVGLMSSSPLAARFPLPSLSLSPHPPLLLFPRSPLYSLPFQLFLPFPSFLLCPPLVFLLVLLLICLFCFFLMLLLPLTHSFISHLFHLLSPLPSSCLSPPLFLFLFSLPFLASSLRLYLPRLFTLFLLTFLSFPRLSSLIPLTNDLSLS